MKKHFIIYLFLVICSNLAAQEYFSRTYDFLNGNERAYSIFPNDKGYYIAGGGIQWDTLEDGSFYGNSDDNHMLTDSVGLEVKNELQSEFGYYYESVDQYQDTIVYYGYKIEDGSKTFSLFYRDIYGDSLTVGSQEYVYYLSHDSKRIKMHNDTLYCLFRYKDNLNLDKSNVHGFIRKMNRQGEVLEEVELIEPTMEFLPISKKYYLDPVDLHIKDNGTMLVSYKYIEWDTVTNKRFLSAAIMKLDKKGGVLWRTQLGGMDDFYNYVQPNILELEDESIVIPWRRDITDYDSMWIYADPTIVFNLDKDGDMNWKYEFPLESNTEAKHINKMIRSENGDIIGIGNNSIHLGKRNGLRLGWTFRMSPQGELLWMHYYINDKYGAENDFQDIVEEEDGSLIIVGGVTDQNYKRVWNNGTYQWLLKLDANGCYEGRCGDIVRIGKPRLTGFTNIWTEKYRLGQEDIEKSYKYNIGKGGFVHIPSYIEYHRIYRSDVTTDEYYDWSSFGYGIRQREERIYLYYSDTNKETIFYDFGMNLGEEITITRIDSSTISYTVIDVDTIIAADGFSRKKLQLIVSDDIGGSNCGYITWIEGMGDTRGLLAPLRDPCQEDSLNRELLCVTSYDDQLYQHPDYDVCWLVSAVEDVVLESNEVYVYPNPSNGDISIILPESMGNITWQIYDRVGQSVMNGKEQGRSEELKINIRNLTVGLYFIELKTRQGDRFRVKWVKN